VALLSRYVSDASGVYGIIGISRIHFSPDSINATKQVCLGCRDVQLFVGREEAGKD
jgi:hypothetical protein